MKLKDIDILILCGWKGKRLRNVVNNIPKPLVEIKGYSFLEYLIYLLKKNGLNRIILCTGYKAEKIEKYFKKKNLGLNILFSKEDQPLGTGGAVKNAESLIKNDHFIILNGDSYCEVNFKNFFNFHLKVKSMISIVITKIKKNIKDFGTVDIDLSGKIIKFKEKDDSIQEGYINAGIYVFNKEVLKMIPPNKKFSLEYELFPKIKECHGFINNGLFIDIGTPERLLKAENILPEVNTQ